MDFELHLTTQSIDNEKIVHFIDVCESLYMKPLLIELARGVYCQQPMATAHFQGDIDSVLAFANELSSCFAEQGFPIIRVKVEVALLALNIGAFLSIQHDCYFEWHGKLKLHHTTELLQLCNQYNAHLSHNALKGEKDLRFVSIRQFVSDKQKFINFVNCFVNKLELGGWDIIKQQFEYCIYDSNDLLDKGWLQ